MSASLSGVHHRTVPAMGTTARLIVVGGAPDLADDAVLRIHDLEARWSRFLPDSEVSRVNSAAGSPCIVSADTFQLIERLVDGWWATAGRFDPTVHDTMLRIGYTRSWPFAQADTADNPFGDMPSPGCADITLDRRSHMVWLPLGVHLDPGGLGKGFAADLIAEELIEDGAEGALVDLGGDIRVVGTSPTGGSWCIGVEHPTQHDTTIAIVETTGGGIATTSRGKRRWNTDTATPLHHVIDPSTGRPAMHRWTSATALAPSAAAAEIAAKVAFIDGTADGAPDVLAALLADADGRLEIIGPHPELFLATDHG
jgi:FAD:protein FMN transferase